MVSVTFTWDIPLGHRIFEAWSAIYSDVRIGGPAFGDHGGEFTPGRFVKEGVTITSRGCSKRCPWCFVPKREGVVRELAIKPGWIVQDNNLLACSQGHIERVFEMLRAQPRGAVFSGGLDTSLLQDWHRSLLDTIRLHEVWVACDTDGALSLLSRAARILDGIPIKKRRCYTMIGFNGETLGQAERRLERVYKLGFLPFCQLYRSDKQRPWSQEWRMLARKWARPAAYRSVRQSPVERFSYEDGWRTTTAPGPIEVQQNPDCREAE